jgi:phytoene synthase
LGKAKRLACYSIYAICRSSDESVDSVKPEEQLKSLNQVKQNIDVAYTNKNLDNAILAAFNDTVNRYKIPKLYFDELLSGMQMDIHKNRYKDFSELCDYCWHVAGVIGLIMLKVFGSKDKEGEKYASDLGIAMQLTNIIRDIKEDFSRGRIYLPLDELQRFKVSEADIAGENCNENFKQLLRFQIARAREYYRESGKGISVISPRRSRFVVLTMKEVYASILDEVEKQDYNVFLKRDCVNGPKKAGLLLKIIAKGKHL